MSKFDPTKRFGHVRGTMPEYPGARYMQGVYFYDIHRRCLNPEAESPDEDVIDDALQSLINEAQKSADDALLRMQKAKTAVEDDATPGKKAALTKAKKVYEKAQTKLDKLLS